MKLYSEAVQLAKEHPRKKGRPKADDEEAAIVKAKAKAEIKNFAYALGKAPEHLIMKTSRQRVLMIAENNSRLYRAYRVERCSGFF